MKIHRLKNFLNTDLLSFNIRYTSSKSLTIIKIQNSKVSDVKNIMFTTDYKRMKKISMNVFIKKKFLRKSGKHFLILWGDVCDLHFNFDKVCRVSENTNQYPLLESHGAWSLHIVWIFGFENRCYLFQVILGEKTDRNVLKILYES